MPKWQQQRRRKGQKPRASGSGGGSGGSASTTSSSHTSTVGTSAPPEAGAQCVYLSRVVTGVPPLRVYLSRVVTGVSPLCVLGVGSAAGPPWQSMFPAPVGSSVDGCFRDLIPASLRSKLTGNRPCLLLLLLLLLLQQQHSSVVSLWAAHPPVCGSSQGGLAAPAAQHSCRGCCLKAHTSEEQHPLTGSAPPSPGAA